MNDSPSARSTASPHHRITLNDGWTIELPGDNPS